ncbi:putative membrane protein [Rhodopirellula sallentina SM41]|uniref:Putative membrane protein n=1 Tax=Rhodopirellula sallentina SM41 TaxID=1263870 RepID=M5U6V3_9BACT|nr:putative membrane protein [Rhodopirellula sallentina SM41]
MTSPDASTEAMAPDATAAIEVAELSGYEWLLTGISLLILFAFTTSLIKWISLLRRRVRFFGEGALLPERPRARPYWNPLYFLFFFAVLIVANLQYNQLAQQYTSADIPATAEPTITADNVINSDDVTQADAGDGDAEEATAGAPEISVLQLLLSSASMVTATIVTMWLALAFRPRIRPHTGEQITGSVRHERPKIGWLPEKGDVTLGFKSAWLILPPTMLLMGLVSVLQKYSHPVLEALKPDGPDSSPDFAVFAALFFTTAIVTPIVEEFWFRGILQGGLQRIADAMHDTRRWAIALPNASMSNATTEADGETTGPARVELTSSPLGTPLANTHTIPAEPIAAETVPSEPIATDPYASPRPAEVAGTPLSEQPTPAELAADFSTRSDWTPTAIWPIVVASILFAVMHWGQGLAPIPLFFLSLGLGYLYRQTGSLVPSIVVHFVLNGFTMSATLLELLR